MLPNYRGRLTEGIVYDERNDTLIWVDIIQAEIHRVFLEDADLEKRHQHIKLNEPRESIGNVALTRDENVVLACTKYGIASASFETGKFNFLLHYNHSDEQKDRLRSNDGTIDPWGNLWIGTMTDFPQDTTEGVKPEGVLYRIDAKDLSVKTMVEGSFISNGLAFSEDRTKFYWTDSLTFTTWQFDYDHSTASLSNRRPAFEFKKIYQESAVPDGFAFTTDEHIIHALFQKGAALEFNTKGEVFTEFKLPAQAVSCVAIGGKDDNELFFTTIHEHVADFTKKIDPENKEGDLGGFIYRIKLDKKINGQKPSLWAGPL